LVEILNSGGPSSGRSTTEAEAEGEEVAKAEAQQRQKQMQKEKEKKRKKKKKKKTNWIRPAPRASGLRPQLDSVVFPPHMRSVKKKKKGSHRKDRSSAAGRIVQ
jgi:hypothetical protein